METFWSTPAIHLLDELQTSDRQGLTSTEANQRFNIYGPNILKPERRTDTIALLLSQFKSPIILIFIFAGSLSFFLGNTEDSIIILTIVVVSSLLGFWQEKGAADAVKKLLKMVQIKSTVLRDGIEIQVPMREVVPGDIIILAAGDSIPGDSLILESKDLYVNEATLTGESYPVEKASKPLLLSAETDLRRRTNSLYTGTYVISGTAKAVVVNTGLSTELGKISERLKLRPPETEFEHGVKRFGYFLGEVTLLLVISILIINVYFDRPVLESFLFSLALAVGLTPQLLPAIIGVNLAHGAKRMAQNKVIVKRLSSIENLGSMNTLCSDKTGTITIGKVQLISAINLVDGNHSNKVLLYAYLNAYYHTGYSNPIDEAILSYDQSQIREKNFEIKTTGTTTVTKMTLKDKNNNTTSSFVSYHKMDEVPYDFIRKRLSILLLVSVNDDSVNDNNSSRTAQDTKHVMVTKGAFLHVLEICSLAELADSTIVDISTVKDKILDQFEKLSNKGFRILGLAYRNLFDSFIYESFPPHIPNATNDNRDLCSTLSTSHLRHDDEYQRHFSMSKEDENSMIFLGFIIFSDPIKPGVIQSIGELKKLGISLKIISGDNELVASYVGQQLGLDDEQQRHQQYQHILTGSEIHHLSAESLRKKVNDVNIFAEIEPNQKEQIILSLKKSGNVVGYMGDGINDAPALHAADVGISVDTAADVVKDSTDIVLLEKDISVISAGVKEGRRTFANTMKYVFMATSANFGNMFSMAGASLFLPFLPLLPKQVLLVNLMTDMPEMTISTDTVDVEMVEKPRKWDIKFIRKFMLYFGLLSTLFDYITFAVLLIALNASTEQFRTAWFMESVISASTIVLIIRTRKMFYKSKPSKYLVLLTLITIGLVILIPYTPIGQIFGFVKVSLIYLAFIAVIVLSYITMAEIVKRAFYKRKYC